MCTRPLFYEVIFTENTVNTKEKPILSRGVLVGLVTRDTSEADVQISLDELGRLLDTAGGVTVARVTQNKDTPDPATVVGSGKVSELSSLCGNENIDVVIFDMDLSPSQIRNLEDGIGHDVRVIDRSMLILDIFALHAVTSEGKLQVELAQLNYSAPRLTGHGKDMSRLGGGIGTRGPGESKLESDKRHIKRRINALQAELDLIEKNRKTMRVARDRSGYKKIAIVGYTNAGKSTLLNRLTDAGILAQDKLFATLDPTTRKLKLPCGESVLATDTVGFIRKLPHHLIEAFKSTLDEAVYADIIMIIADASDDECPEQLLVTENLLTELGVAGKPVIYVYNKCDRGIRDTPVIGKTADRQNIVYISALTGQGVELLLNTVERVIHEGATDEEFLIPNSEQGVLNILYKNATINNIEYRDENVLVSATVDAKVRGKLDKYRIKENTDDN